MRSVYFETTVVSYLTAKPSRDLVVAAHQQVTPELPSEGWCFVGNARVLDLCCGMGGLSVAAREMGMRAVAGGGAPHNATGSTEHGKAPAT